MSVTLQCLLVILMYHLTQSGHVQLQSLLYGLSKAACILQNLFSLQNDQKTFHPRSYESVLMKLLSHETQLEENMEGE